MYFELDNGDMESSKRRSIFTSLISILFLSASQNLLSSEIIIVIIIMEEAPITLRGFQGGPQ